MIKIFKKIIFLVFLVLILGFLLSELFTCTSRYNPEHSSFRVCLRRLAGRDNPPPEPTLKPEYTIQIIEGWSINEIANHLDKQEIFTQFEFLEAVNNIDDKVLARFDFLADRPESANLQGYLYPDTYRIFTNAKPEDLIIRMLENFDRKLNSDLREEIASQGKTIYEILTMASLIEKEAPINYSVGDNYDAKMIGGIFWQRIANNQALQSCATLAYILGVNKEQYSEADTRVDSPYNTYRHPGLPPGPITNPGILAIEAAIYPISNNYNFFLTPTGTRDIIYSRTYQEHLNNKYKYIR